MEKHLERQKNILPDYNHGDDNDLGCFRDNDKQLEIACE